MFRQFAAVSVVFTIQILFVNTLFGQAKKEYSVDLKTLGIGQEVFTTNCASCHDLKNDGIGPKLGGVTNIISQKSLTEFIKDPAKIIASGDKRSGILHRKYKLTMPPFDFLKPAEIQAVLAYIHHATALQKITPLVVTEDKSKAGQPVVRLGTPISKSGLRIELADFIQIPPSDTKKPLTRIANMRPHPSGDGSLLVSDQRGIIYQVRNGQTTVFLDVRGIPDFINTPGLGTGLGSFAFHPEYLKNGLLYVTHTEKFIGKKADYEYADSIKVEMQWVVEELKMKDPEQNVFDGTKRELLRVNVTSPVHGMQDIEFIPGISKNDPDYGLLFIGTGDGGSTISRHPELCHDLKSLLGTIIRIDPLGTNSPNGKYGIPSDNPFVKDPDERIRKEIYAYGFRNPHRLSWDLPSGKTMFSAEVGESNFEEVNVIVKGGDYGWNLREGKFGMNYNDLKNVYTVDTKDRGHFIDPFAAYDHIDGNAVSGGYVYRGEITALKDKYIFGDIVHGRLFYLNINKALSDSSIHEIGIMENGKETDLIRMSNSKRVDLRIEYNPLTREMYIMTKSDGRIRRITNAFFEKKP